MSADEITIRQASLQDLEVVLRLRLDMLREVGSLGEEARAAELVAANRRYLEAAIPEGRFLVWLAERAGRPVAIVALIPFERPPTGDNPAGLEGYVLNMYTVPSWRRRGLGARLLEQCIEYVRARGGRRLWLKATPAGRPLYEQAGFVVLGGGGPRDRTVEMALVW
jgi:GNAT superfamily N-acetyltransferase